MAAVVQVPVPRWMQDPTEQAARIAAAAQLLTAGTKTADPELMAAAKAYLLAEFKAYTKEIK